MSTAVPVQPDVEAFAWSQLRTLPGTTSFCYSAILDWPGWLYLYSLQVDVRSKRKKAARDVAESARRIMLALPDLDWSDGVVARVDVTEGPFWNPDPEDGGPRYTSRYEVRVHPRAFLDGNPVVAHPPLERTQP